MMAWKLMKSSPPGGWREPDRLWNEIACCGSGRHLLPLLVGIEFCMVALLGLIRRNLLFGNDSFFLLIQVQTSWVWYIKIKESNINKNILLYKHSFISTPTWHRKGHAHAKLKSSCGLCVCCGEVLRLTLPTSLCCVLYYKVNFFLSPNPQPLLSIIRQPAKPEKSMFPSLHG